MFMDQPTKNNVTFQMYYVCRSKLETAEAALVKEHQIFNNKSIFGIKFIGFIGDSDFLKHIVVFRRN